MNYIIIVVCLIVVYFFINTKEKLTNNTTDTHTLHAEKLLNFITPDTTFTSYLDFITNNNITSLKLINQEIFYELKIKKQLGLLNNDYLVTLM